MLHWVISDYDLHSCLEPGRKSREKPGGQFVRKKSIRVIRKPYKTPTFYENNINQLIKNDLGEDKGGVLSGSKTRKWIYLETI
jgi:hypothetical protein